MNSIRRKCRLASKAGKRVHFVLFGCVWQICSFVFMCAKLARWCGACRKQAPLSPQKPFWSVGEKLLRVRGSPRGALSVVSARSLSARAAGSPLARLFALCAASLRNRSPSPNSETQTRAILTRFALHKTHILYKSGKREGPKYSDFRLFCVFSVI